MRLDPQKLQFNAQKAAQRFAHLVLCLVLFLTTLFPLNSLGDSSLRTRKPQAVSTQSDLGKTTGFDLHASLLEDPMNRIDAEFKVPPRLQQRTKFWFDIYSKYGSAHHVIHHTRFPWIIFEVVDASDLMNGSGPMWMRRQRALDLVQKRKLEIRAALARLERKKSYDNLSPLEQHLFLQLETLPGARKKVFRFARTQIRSQLGQKDFFLAGLKQSSAYLQHMEQHFVEFGLPAGLVRLPFVESSFNLKAQSRIGASGIWQIMPRTGSAYMIVTQNIDERNSPLKSTHLAARLFRQYKKALGSWPLAITAYNHGIGNIRKAIRAAHSNDLAEIIEKYHRGDFRFASSNFYTSFLAALYAEKYRDVLFEDLPREPLLEYEPLKLRQQISLSKISSLTGLDRATLIRYNLDLRRARAMNFYFPRGYELHLPPGTRERLQERLSAGEKASSPRRKS